MPPHDLVTDRDGATGLLVRRFDPDRWLPGLDSLPFDRGQVAKLRRVIEHRRGRLTT